jgi:broad specificity phosphatase PhoE
MAERPNLVVVHIVRHGEVHNPEKILYGRALGFRLSVRGEQMAAAAGKYLAEHSLARPVAYVAASPLERAQQTAQVIADRFDQSVATDERLLESQNLFAGRRVRRRDLLRNMHRLYNPFRPSWDEPYRSIAERMIAAVHAARDVVAGDGSGGTAVLVSHQLPIWIMRRHLSKQRLWHSPSRRQCALGSVTSLTFRGSELTDIAYHVPAPELVAAALAEDRAARIIR